MLRTVTAEPGKMLLKYDDDEGDCIKEGLSSYSFLTANLITSSCTLMIMG